MKYIFKVSNTKYTVSVQQVLTKENIHSSKKIESDYFKIYIL